MHQLFPDYMAIVPEGHPLEKETEFPVNAFEEEPFLLLEQGGNDEIARLLAAADASPDVRFITWDDYAVMSMVEQGLGLAVLPRLIMRRVPYRVVALPLSTHDSRSIGLVLRDSATASAATQRFLDYVKYR